MTRTFSASLSAMVLTEESELPLYRQLYQRFCQAILSGKLSPGERVPSIRALASELRVSRGTIELAYQILISEGYLISRGAAGTFVQLGLKAVSSVAPPPKEPRQSLRHYYATIPPMPFQLGIPALDAFPLQSWTRILGRMQREFGLQGMLLRDPTGFAPLKNGIATYLGISRGIACSPEQVFITAGYHGALELICRSLLVAGEKGWYEDPGYFHGRQHLQKLGMSLIPVDVDQAGICVDKGKERAPDARFAVVTPSHQSPTGVALSLPRRMALLDWANQQDAWIIEDDYDSEFRYSGKPLPALKSLDSGERVLYTGTFSKVLFPALKLGYLVVPNRLVNTIQEVAFYANPLNSLLQQATLAEFMSQGHFSRHLRKMRILYAQRRHFLVQALQTTFGDRLRVQEQAGGIHLLAWLMEQERDDELAQAAQEAGLAIQPLSHWRVAPSSQGALLMSFTNLADLDTARCHVERLKKAWN